MRLIEPQLYANILPFDGEVYYAGKIMDDAKAERYYKALLASIEWKHDEAVMFGRHILTKRKAAWYGDKPYPYTYSRITKYALPWTDDLLELKALAEQKTGALFNSCLLNLYHDGTEGMAWHSDDEKALQPRAPIASMSFGAIRKFGFRHKRTKEALALYLEPGSLLVMQGSTQINWTHRLPPTKTVKTPRINLTFRTMM